MSKKDKENLFETGASTNPGTALNALYVWLVQENISHLMGQILTVIDASTEGDKNKAMKDLVKKAFSDKQEWINELAWKQRVEEGDGKSCRDSWEDGLLPIPKLHGNKFAFVN